MDRIELVETLQEKYRKLVNKKAELRSKVDEAEKRTWDYIEAKFKEPDPKNITHENIGFCVSGCANIAYGSSAEDYSIDKVIDLGHSIKECQKEIEDLERKLVYFQNRDVVKYLKDLIKE